MDSTLRLLETSLITGTYLNLSDQRVDDLELNDEIIAGSFYKQIEFTKVTFENCKLQASEFQATTFIECRFENCNFEFVRFSNCIFINCEFFNCSFGAVWSDECLGEANKMIDCDLDLSPSFEFLFEDEVRFQSLGILHQQIQVVEAVAA